MCEKKSLNLLPLHCPDNPSLIQSPVLDYHVCSTLHLSIMEIRQDYVDSEKTPRDK